MPTEMTERLERALEAFARHVDQYHAVAEVPVYADVARAYREARDAPSEEQGEAVSERPREFQEVWFEEPRAGDDARLLFTRGSTRVRAIMGWGAETEFLWAAPSFPNVRFDIHVGGLVPKGVWIFAQLGQVYDAHIVKARIEYEVSDD